MLYRAFAEGYCSSRRTCRLLWNEWPCWPPFAWWVNMLAILIWVDGCWWCIHSAVSACTLKHLKPWLASWLFQAVNKHVYCKLILSTLEPVRKTARIPPAKSKNSACLISHYSYWCWTQGMDGNGVCWDYHYIILWIIPSFPIWSTSKYLRTQQNTGLICWRIAGGNTNTTQIPLQMVAKKSPRSSIVVQALSRSWVPIVRSSICFLQSTTLSDLSGFQTAMHPE